MPTMTRTLRLLTLFAALCGSHAQAACRLDTLSALLPPYSVLQNIQGTLRVVVSCDHVTDAYKLDLDAARENLQNAGQVMRLTLFQNDVPFQATLSGDLNVLRGRMLRGPQTFFFDLNVAAGQWVPPGNYRAQLHLTLTDSPAADHP